MHELQPRAGIWGTQAVLWTTAAFRPMGFVASRLEGYIRCPGSRAEPP